MAYFHVIRRRFDRLRPAPPQKVLVVLGARSGSSALAGALGLAGLQLPRNLMPANWGNVKGYFEPQDLADLHDRILASAGSAWDDHRAFPRAWFDSPAARLAEAEICATYRQNYPLASIAVLKEPRMCRLLPIWYRAFDRLKLTPVFCFIDRSPMEVAASLRERDGSTLAHGLLYYIRNHLDAEYDSRKSPRVFVSYDDLLSNWRRTLAKIGGTLRLPISPSAEQAATVDDFLESRLRHQKIPAADAGDAISATAVAVHEAFTSLSVHGERRKVRMALDRLRAAHG